MENKYRLTKETVSYRGHTLHRIEALKDFGNVNKGDRGGWVEKEANLSQEGDCWISGGAKVYDNAQVYGDARVLDNALVYDYAKVYGDAWVRDDAQVYGDAQVCGDARVFDNALVYDYARVYGDAWVCGHAQVYDGALVYGDTNVYGNVRVCRTAVVEAKSEICGDAVVEKMGDYVVFQNWWSSRRWFTYTKSNGMWKVGCFYGTGEELVRKAYADSEEKGRMYEATVNYLEAIERLKNNPNETN